MGDKVLANNGHYLEEHLKMTQNDKRKVLMEDYKPQKEADND